MPHLETNLIMKTTVRWWPAAIQPLMMLFSHMQGATLAELSSGESTVYVVDSSDLVGPAVSGISPTAGTGTVCVNNFSILSAYSTITDVTVQWSLMYGTTYFTAGIWSDPDQDGIPDDAVLLTTSALTPAVAGEYLQQVNFPSPQFIGPDGTSFFVGIYWQESLQQGVDLFMGKDRPIQGEYASWQKKWTAMPPNPSDLSGATVYQGTHRAFVIRPTGVVPEPSVGLLLATAAWPLTRRNRTRRRI